MRSLAASLTFVCLAFTAAAVEAQTPVDRHYRVKPDGLIRIWNLAGTVKVTGWDRDSVVVTGAISETGGASWFGGSTADGAKLGVWSDEPGPALKPSHIEVMVPRASRIRVETGSSETNVAGVTGALDIVSVTGAVIVRGNPAEVVAESLSGEITIDAQARNVRIKTASGNIRISGAIRDAVATTVSGNVTVEGDRFEKGTFETVDGDIHYLGNVGGGTLDFVNHSGAVDFLVSSSASAEFVISTFFGGFDDQFGVNAKYSGNKLKGTEVRFSVGAGGGVVTVRNFKGRVILRRKG